MIKKILTITLLSILINGCVSGRADLENMIQQMDQDPPEKYEAVLNLFFSYAQVGDIEKMLSITSDVTISQVGLSEVTQLYKQDISPALKSCGSLLWGGHVVHVTQGQSGTGSGWIYIKKCSNTELNDVNLKFVILNEGARIVVTSVGVI